MDIDMLPIGNFSPTARRLAIEAAARRKKWFSIIQKSANPPSPIKPCPAIEKPVYVPSNVELACVAHAEQQFRLVKKGIEKQEARRRAIEETLIEARAAEPDSPGDIGVINIADIQRCVCSHFGLARVDLLLRRRTKNIVHPRMIAMWLARKLTGRSFPEIGRCFGGMDHTSVMYAVRKINLLMAAEEGIRTEIGMLREWIELKSAHMEEIALALEVAE